MLKSLVVAAAFLVVTGACAANGPVAPTVTPTRPPVPTFIPDLSDYILALGDAGNLRENYMADYWRARYPDFIMVYFAGVRTGDIPPTRAGFADLVQSGEVGDIREQKVVRAHG